MPSSFLLNLREATDEENQALDRTAEAVKAEVEGDSGVTIDIVYNRLNRRKIDLIPEWADPPKSLIGKLLKQTEKRLRQGGTRRASRGPTRRRSAMPASSAWPMPVSPATSSTSRWG